MSIFQSGAFFMGFDMDPTAAQIFSQAAAGVASTTQTPFGFGFAWQTGSSVCGILLGTNLTTLVCGFRAFIQGSVGTSSIIASFFDATANATQVSLRLNSTGQLQFFLGSGTGTPIGSASSAGTMSGSTWAYVECTVTISATVGFVECKVNGTTVITTAATQNTKSTANTFVNAFQFQGTNPSYFDDLYMLDGTGSSPLNTYLSAVGMPQVREEAPNANSAVGGRNAWTPTNPTNVNFSNVANIPAVTTKFNADATPGDYDMFRFPSLPSNTATVLAINEWALLLLDSAGARTVELNCYSGGTDSAGTAFTPGATAAYANHISTVDPNTGSAWTVANAGAAELGVKVQS